MLRLRILHEYIGSSETNTGTERKMHIEITFLSYITHYKSVFYEQLLNVAYHLFLALKAVIIIISRCFILSII